MSNDVVIGSGIKQNSAVLLRDNISHNSTSYWITTDFLSISMVVFKNAPEGVELTHLLQVGASKERVDRYLWMLVCRNCDPELLHNRIAWALKNSYDAGGMAARAKIRRALGIDNG